MQANKAYCIDTHVQENYSLKCHFHTMVLGTIGDWDHCINLIFWCARLCFSVIKDHL